MADELALGMEARLYNFLRESNKIEGMDTFISLPELEAAKAFLRADFIDIPELVTYVKVIQPNARLRDRPGLDVTVGNYTPPPGGPDLPVTLHALLNATNMRLDDELHSRSQAAYDGHVFYEKLHPFTDGNGRSGRLLWVWCMGGIERVPLLFLHTFYYQALQATQ